MTDNTVALVTGANKGIGRQIAAQLAAKGLTVLLAGRNPELVRAAASELGVHPIVLDVTDEDSVRAAADQVEREFGRLDVLVNNAGISGGRGDNSTASVRRVYETNVFGVITVTNAFLPLLLRSPAARVVNVSSTVGSLAWMSSEDYALPFLLAYPSSKSALNALTIQYATEYGKQGVLVNSVCPGYCATDLNGNNGHRTAEQGAAIAVKLATIGPDGPNGGFFDDAGPVAW